MQTNTIFQNPEINNIIIFYRKLSYFIFKYGIFCVVLLFTGLYLLFAQFTDSADILANKKVKTKFYKSIPNGYIGDQIFIGDKLNISGITINIINGIIYNTGNKIISSSNLTSYKGYILPFNYVLTNIQDIQPISYFNTGNYNINELNKYFENIIFINGDNNKNQGIGKPKITEIKGSLKKTFNLDCIGNSALLKNFCQKNINDFIDFLGEIDLSKVDANDFIVIAKEIIDNGNKQGFCDSLLNNLYNSYNIFPNQDTFFDLCGEEYMKKYKFIAEYKKLDADELSKLFFKQNVFANADLNILKLVTFQNSIYSDLSNSKNGKIENINIYLNFLENLLKSKNFPKFYYDQIYSYNNNYLLKTLSQKQSEGISVDIQNIISKISDRIEKINVGDPLQGYISLKKSVQHKNLVSLIKNNSLVPSSRVTSKMTLEQLFKDNIKKFTYLIVLDLKVKESDRTIILKGKMKVGSAEFKTPEQDVNVLIKYIYNGGLFEITNFKIVDPKDIADNIKEVTARLQDIIDKQIKESSPSLDNIKLYMDQYYGVPKIEIKKVSICEKLESERDKIEKQIPASSEKKYSLKILLCDDKEQKLISLSKITTINDANYSYETSYKFYFDDVKLTDIKISDQKLEKDIKANFANSNDIVLPTLIEYITSVIKVELQSSSSAGDVCTFEDKKIISETFSKYLNTKPDKIICRKGGITYMEFGVKDIYFIAYLSVKDNYKVYNLSYYNKTTKDRRMIKNLTLNLTDQNEVELTNFKLEPLKKIQEADPESYKYITEKKKSNN